MFEFPQHSLEYFVGVCAAIYGAYTIYLGELRLDVNDAEGTESTRVVMDGWYGTFMGSLMLSFGILCLIFPEESSMAVGYILEVF